MQSYKIVPTRLLKHPRVSRLLKELQYSIGNREGLHHRSILKQSLADLNEIRTKRVPVPTNPSTESQTEQTGRPRTRIVYKEIEKPGTSYEPPPPVDTRHSQSQTEPGFVPPRLPRFSDYVLPEFQEDAEALLPIVESVVDSSEENGRAEIAELLNFLVLPTTTKPADWMLDYIEKMRPDIDKSKIAKTKRYHFSLVGLQVAKRAPRNPNLRPRRGKPLPVVFQPLRQ